MPDTFKILYYFNNPYNSIIEIKRNHFESETDLSKVYYWILYEKKTHRLYPLQFISMKDALFAQERVFKQGKFVFNEQEGTLHNSTDHGKMVLKRMPNSPIPKLLKIRIDEFLLMVDKQNEQQLEKH